MITRFIPGVLIGAVIASAAFLLLDRSRDDKNPASTETHAIGVEGGRLSSDTGERNFPVKEVVQSSEPLRNPGKNSSPPNGGVTMLGGFPCQTCLPPDSALPPPDLPIHLPPEFEWLRRMDTFRRFERSPIDYNWSPQAEIQLSSYFAQHQEFVRVYGMPTVQCRKTECLAMFAAPRFLDYAENYPDPKVTKNGIGSGAFIFGVDFKKEFFDDPIGKQFNKEELGVAGRIRDRDATFYLMMRKRKPDSNAVAPSTSP